MPVGRPPKFQSPEHLFELFETWKETFTTENTDIPDVEGFCVYVDAYRDILSEYEKKEEYSDTIKRIKNWIYYKKKQLAMQNKMNATIFIFDAKNNAGYVDKTEYDTNNNHTVKFSDMTDDQLERAIQARQDRTA
jgi:hypothetical protein